MDRATATMPISVALQFLDSQENPVQVNDLTLSDIQIQGGTVSNLQSTGLTHTFDLNSIQKPSRIFLEIDAGNCKDDQNITNSYGSVAIVYSDIVTKSEDLVGWWTFDELNGSNVVDSSGSDQPLTLWVTPSSIPSTPPLEVTPLNWMVTVMVPKVFGLNGMTVDKAYRFDDLELWWPLDGNYSDMSGNGRNATATVNEANPWQEGRYGQAFTFTGNDHLEASNPLYRGISGTGARDFINVGKNH